MITSRKMLREYLRADVVASKKPPIAMHIIPCWLMGWYNMLYINYMRRCEYYKGASTGIIFKILGMFYKFLMRRLGNRIMIQIPQNTFGKGLYIPHCGPIIVNGSASFGDNCVVQSGVVICEGVQGGNHLYLAAGAKILRNVILADDIIVGANAVVSKSFLEPNVVVGGIPAKKISDNGFRNRTVV